MPIKFYQFLISLPYFAAVTLQLENDLDLLRMKLVRKMKLLGLGQGIQNLELCCEFEKYENVLSESKIEVKCH